MDEPKLTHKYIVSRKLISNTYCQVKTTRVTKLYHKKLVKGTQMIL